VDETDKAGYIARQYFAYNLSDRLVHAPIRCCEFSGSASHTRPVINSFHTHPFLTDIERKWFAYQLLCAVEQCHSVGVRHGDIKTENVMVQIYYGDQFPCTIRSIRRLTTTFADVMFVSPSLVGLQVTTWNWLFLTDISFYKPTDMPADNPADYTAFFDSGQRRRFGQACPACS